MRSKNEKAAEGADLARVRKSAGMTQQDLADAMGVHRATIAVFEAGTDTIDRKTVLAFCAVITQRTKSKGVAKAIEEVWSEVTGTPWDGPASSN